MLEPGKITRSGGTSKGSAQKDTLLREASKALIRQGKMWVIASRRDLDAVRLAQVADDLPRAHAARVHRDHLVVEAGEAALVLGDQLRVEARPAVARHRQL